MGLKTPTPLLKGNRPIVQKVMGTCPRDSASLEPPLALVRALRVSQQLRVNTVDLRHCYFSLQLSQHCGFFASDTPDLKRSADHDESPPLTPTGNAPSSESELDISSPNASHDESQAKDQASRDSDKDLSHRPKRRRCHETYNFNMKCPTPGCNSLGKHFFTFLFYLPSMRRDYSSCILMFLLCTVFAGHLTGKHERHFAVSGCPLYHNLSADECKVNIIKICDTQKIKMPDWSAMVFFLN